MSTKDILQRYLTARADVDENAGVLAACIKNDNKPIDAVEIESKDLNLANRLLEYSDLTYSLLNINNHFILLYPNEQREKYMSIQPYMAFGGDMIEYAGVTYSEAIEMRDFMNAAGVSFKSATDHDGRIKFMVSKNNEDIMNRIIKAVGEEAQTSEGKKYLIAQNLCWSHVVNQAAIVLNSKSVFFIGREGGTGGIRIDADGAVVMTPKGPGRFIPRADSKFDTKVIDAMLYDLNGEKTPVKSFSGNFADILTTGMHKEDSQNIALTLKQALKIMSYDGLPGIDELDAIINNIDNYNNEQKNAIFALARMTMCREQTLEGFDEYKLTKKDKSDFSILHQKYMNEFALTKEENHER